MRERERERERERRREEKSAWQRGTWKRAMITSEQGVSDRNSYCEITSERCVRFACNDHGNDRHVRHSMAIEASSSTFSRRFFKWEEG